MGPMTQREIIDSYWADIRGVRFPQDVAHWFWTDGRNMAGREGQHPTLHHATISDACVFFEIAREELLALPKEVDAAWLSLSLYVVEGTWTDAFMLRRGEFSTMRAPRRPETGRVLTMCCETNQVLTRDFPNLHLPQLREAFETRLFEAKNALMAEGWTPDCFEGETVEGALQRLNLVWSNTERKNRHAFRMAADYVLTPSDLVVR